MIRSTPATERQVVLHIGTHKTGTTAVQMFADRNREALLARGVLYPASGIPPDRESAFGQHLLATSLFSATPNDSAWDAVRAEFEQSGASQCLISSENFCRVTDPAQVEKIRERLGAVRLKMVVYLRRQDLYMQALYCTDVLHYGQKTSIDQYITANAGRANYLHMLQPWSQVLGDEALTVRVYEPAQLHRRDIIDDLFSVIGQTDLSDLTRPSGRINHSYPRAAIGALVEMRQRGARPGEQAALIQLIRRLYRDMPAPLDLLAPSAARAVLDRFRSSNQDVAARYLRRVDAPLFEQAIEGDDGPWLTCHGTGTSALATFLAEVQDRLFPQPEPAAGADTVAPRGEA